jgi:rRNA maturation protein Nop10
VTTIKASCPSCGEVELTSDDIRLRVCSHGQLSYYTFICPSCVENIRKPADDHIVSLLMSGGVEAEVWDVPAEALEPKAGAEITYDDLLDFLLQLSRDDLLAARASAPAHH